MKSHTRTCKTNGCTRPLSMKIGHVKGAYCSSCASARSRVKKAGNNPDLMTRGMLMEIEQKYWDARGPKSGAEQKEIARSK